MFRRSRPLARPTSIQVDGETLPADEGEPLAASLLGAGLLTLSRSPKLHRPRGPSCLRGGCDGCLMRVDGVPNVMTCLHAVRGGERVETQNVLGTREVDLLRGADWFFPNGIDHHHLFAGTPGLSSLVQSVARKISGLGRLPDLPADVPAAERLACDVVVVGGGAAGRTVASEVAARGARCVLLDDAVALGGALRGAPELLAALEARRPIDPARVTARPRTVAAGLYDGEVIAVGHVRFSDEEGSEHALRIRARAVVLATGAHDGVWVGPGNDLPGVLSARALARLLALGLRPTVPVAVVGAGPWAARLLDALDDATAVAEADLVEILGRSRVKGVRVRGGRGDARLACGLVALALPPAPAFELAGHAGGAPRFTGHGFAPPRAGGLVVAATAGAPPVYAAGECAGVGEALDEIEADAADVAAAVTAALRA